MGYISNTFRQGVFFVSTRTKAPAKWRRITQACSATVIVTIAGTRVYKYNVSRYNKAIELGIPVGDEAHQYGERLRKRAVELATFELSDLIHDRSLPNDEDLDRLRRFGVSRNQIKFAALHFCPIDHQLRMMKILIERLRTSLIPLITSLKDDPANEMTYLRINNLVEAHISNLVRDGTFTAIDAIDVTQVTGNIKNWLPNHLTQSSAQSGKSSTSSTSPHSSTSPPSSTSPHLNVTTAVDKFIDHLRCTIEEYLMANWEYAGYLDPVSYREGFFARRNTLLAEERSVGTRSSTLLMGLTDGSAGEGGVGEVKGVGGGEVRGLSVETIAEATKILKEKGFVIIRGALAANEVKEMKDNLQCDETKNDDSSSTYQRLLFTDCNLYRHVVPVGRTHLLIRTSLFEQLPLSYQHRWLPLVYTHLKSEVFNSSTALDSWASQGHRMRNWVAYHLKHDQTDDAGMIPGSPQNPTQRIYLSCLRLIIADPLASRTSWHRDRE
eukprot:GHVN01026730.1.p1 GENE.GHVN01026730.1~~GHVN01026730.1.p1  ORF type:complete len:496 (+),score=111.45 GHVN01026730.1:37-1524(+)